MLKYTIASLPAGLLLSALVAAAPAQAQSAQAQVQVAQGRAPSRIGFVYTERLMTDSKMAKAADAKLAAEFSKRQKAVEEIVTRFKKASDKFDDEAPGLNQLDRERRARELYSLQKDAERMQNEYYADLQFRKNEERAAIAKRAYELVQQVAAQEHLDAVLAEAAWVHPRIDITDKILKLLDQ